MSAPFSTLLLDTVTYDLTVDAQGNIARADPPYAAAQDMGSACRLYQGEYIYDQTRGVPLTTILGQSPSLAMMKSDFATAALTVPATSGAKCFISQIEDRLVTGQVQATVAGTVVASAVSGG